MSELYDEEPVMEMIRIAVEGGRTRALADAVAAVAELLNQFDNKTDDDDLIKQTIYRCKKAIRALEEGKDE